MAGTILASLHSFFTGPAMSGRWLPRAPTDLRAAHHGRRPLTARGAAGSGRIQLKLVSTDGGEHTAMHTAANLFNPNASDFYVRF